MKEIVGYKTGDSGVVDSDINPLSILYNLVPFPNDYPWSTFQEWVLQSMILKLLL